MVSNSLKKVAELESVAREIEQYFSNHPDAGDTAEGIANWWVSHQVLSNSTPIVLSALEYLVGQGVLLKRKYGGREIYTSNGEAL